MNKNDRKAILVVDAQNGFNRNKYTSKVCRDIIKEVNREKYDYIVTSKFINKKGSPFMEIMDWHKMTEDDKEDIDVISNIEDISDLIVKKDTYSAVTDILLGTLRNEGIGEIFLVGMDSEACVYATALGLFDNGIKPKVIENLCASSGGKEYHINAMNCLKRTLGELY